MVKKRPNPQEERVKLHGNWREMIKKALEKQRPPSGWPAGKEKKPKE